jgi:hypothetical protein
MTKDPIVEDVRAIRDAWAQSFAYDLDAIYEDIKRRERDRRHPPRNLEHRTHQVEATGNDERAVRATAAPSCTASNQDRNHPAQPASQAMTVRIQDKALGRCGFTSSYRPRQASPRSAGRLVLQQR